MSIFWRYLLTQYLKVFLLAVVSFIAILLVSRLEEIAHFATMGAPISTIACFILYQIPYILPIAVPISCLISAMIFFQNLSHTQELTAFRSGGIPLRMIIAPILVASSFLSLGNFYISSELSTASHLATKRMLYNLTSVKPLILLQNAKIAKLKGAYVQMDPLRHGEAAKDLVISVHNRGRDRLSLLLAKQLEMKEGELAADHVTLITTAPSTSPNGFDHLMIENQLKTKSPAPEFAHLLRKQGWKIANDNLRFSLLRIRLAQLKQCDAEQRVINKCYSEISRRFSLGIAPLTFTLRGIAFGMEISRNRSKRSIAWVLALAAFALTAFFVGKELDHLFWIASCFFLLPHITIIGCSLRTLHRINRGIES